MLSFTSIGDSVVDNYPKLKTCFLGGTAFNAALNAKKAGASVSLISAVGSDAWGQKYLSTLKKHRIKTNYLSISKAKTSHINISLDQHHRPIYSKWCLGALKSLKLTAAHQAFLKNQHLIRCTAFIPLLPVLTSFCRMNLANTFKIADFGDDSIYSPKVNLIPQYSPNLNLIVKSLNLSDKQSLAFLKNLAQKQNKMVLVLLGNRGSRVFTKAKTFFQPAIKTQAVDTTGASDAYLPVFAINYLATKNIQKSMLLATQAAAKKITRLGASS